MVSLNQIKSFIKNPTGDSTESGGSSQDNVVSRVDQCKVIWYQWSNELQTTTGSVFDVVTASAFPNTFLAESRSYDISNHIQSFSYSKDMQGAAGSFELVLENSFDWSKYMRPGQWLTGFLCGDGTLPMPAESNKPVTGPKSFLNSILAQLLTPTEALTLPAGPDSATVQGYKPYLRTLGIIQRVGIRSYTNTDGVAELSYVITGKDYGTIYEETELWFNASHADGTEFTSKIQAISKQFTRNLTDLLDKWHDIFLNPSAELSKSANNIRSFFPEQWVLPDRLVKDLGMTFKTGSGGYWGDLNNVKEFNATVFENTDPLPLNGLEGRCWDRLKSLSEQGYHELFTEISDQGNPKLIFRPTPWAMDKSQYPVIGSLMLSYADLKNPKGAPQPLKMGTVVTNLKDRSAFDNLIRDAKEFVKVGLDDKRDYHVIPLTAKDVDSFDVGPDYHSRANFFLADSIRTALSQLNSFALINAYDVTFPYRDVNDIKRHGFRPMFVSINTPLTINNSTIFGANPEQELVLELNAILKDFYANAEDYYSGTINITAAKNTVKLGKVIVTDSSFNGISNMVFYVESYTDNFSVDSNGTGTWTQSVTVTRGISEEALDGKVSSKNKAPSTVSTFHANPATSAPGGDSLLGKVKNSITDPTKLFKG